MFNINDYVTPETVSLIITLVIIPAFVKGLNIAAKALEHKIGNDNCNKYVEAGEKAIETAVTSVSQTYVDSLKASGSFDKAAQAEAFELAKQKAFTVLGADAKCALKEIYGDLDTYLESRIEYYVKQGKTASNNISIKSATEKVQVPDSEADKELKQVAEGYTLAADIPEQAAGTAQAQ